MTPPVLYSPHKPEPLPEHDGVMVVSYPRATVGLIVADGKVVGGPPYARSWAIGAQARRVWDEAATKGATVTWHSA